MKGAPFFFILVIKPPPLSSSQDGVRQTGTERFTASGVKCHMWMYSFFHSFDTYFIHVGKIMLTLPLNIRSISPLVYLYNTPVNL